MLRFYVLLVRFYILLLRYTFLLNYYNVFLHAIKKNERMKVAIIGSRSLAGKSIDFSAYLPKGVSTIISGGAKGIDTMAAEYAVSHGINLMVFRPNYERYGGRIAPLRRNHNIVSAADEVLAFWDGVSHGTMYTVNLAKQLGKPVTLVTLPV